MGQKHILSVFDKHFSCIYNLWTILGILCQQPWVLLSKETLIGFGHMCGEKKMICEVHEDVVNFMIFSCSTKSYWIVSVWVCLPCALKPVTFFSLFGIYNLLKQAQSIKIDGLNVNLNPQCPKIPQKNYDKKGKMAKTTTEHSCKRNSNRIG